MIKKVVKGKCPCQFRKKFKSVWVNSSGTPVMTEILSGKETKYPLT